MLGLCPARRRGPRTLRHRGSEGAKPSTTPRCASARAWSAPSPTKPARSTCPTPRATRPSATCRRRAKRSTTRSSACRCCRAGRTLGVLVVQNKAHRTYHEEEVEALQTTAMVLAEMIAVGELSGLGRPGTVARTQAADRDQRPAAVRRRRPRPGRAARAARGGHRAGRRGRRRRNRAGSTRRSPACACSSTTCCRATTSRRPASIATSSKPTACSPTTAAGCGACTRRSATACRRKRAVEKVQSDMRARMLRQTAPFLRERLHDFDDLTNRLLRVLMNKPHGPGGEELPKDAIIVARNMGAAELLDYDREHIRGLVLEEGGPTSHVTVVARALGIRRGRPRRQCRGAGRQWRRGHRRRHRRRGASAPQSPTSRRPMPRRCASAPSGRSSTSFSVASRR